MIKFQSDIYALVFEPFKAKCIHREDFLKANLDHNLSFICCIIYTSHSQVIVRGGIKWKVGDGSSIKV